MYRAALRQAAFDHYGGACVCCGERRATFLTFDRIGGGGRMHRASMSCPGGTLKWMRNNGYPPIYQTMCWNCNWSKHVNGGKCDHVLERESAELPIGLGV